MTRPLPPAESLIVEFKSDRKRLPDAELIEAVVCLANAEGGESDEAVDGQLAALREFKRVTAEELAGRIQRDTVSAKRTLEALTEVGFVDAHGTTRGRNYTLSAAVYRRQGDKAAYTCQAGFTALQNEQMVLNYVRQHGQIKRAEVMELCRLSEGQAKDLLERMLGATLLQLEGAGRGAFYRIGERGRKWMETDGIG